MAEWDKRFGLPFQVEGHRIEQGRKRERQGTRKGDGGSESSESEDCARGYDDECGKKTQTQNFPPTAICTLTLQKKYAS
eukprot:m.12320 g.12320  ORF g.12320 m.12320 type:complete len:79 (-) comp9245_c0_seq1:291-527(-)